MKLKTKEAEKNRKVAWCYFTPTLAQERVLWYYSFITSVAYNFFRAIILPPKKGENMNEEQSWAYGVLCALIENESQKPNPPKSLTYMVSLREKFDQGKTASKPELFATLGPLRNSGIEEFEFLKDMGALDLQKIVAKVHDNKGSFFGLKKASDDKVRLMKKRSSVHKYKSIFFDGKSCQVVEREGTHFLHLRQSVDGAPVVDIELPVYARFDKNKPENNVLFSELDGNISVVTISREKEHYSEKSRFKLILTYFSEGRQIEVYDDVNVGIELGIRHLTVYASDGRTKQWHLPQIATYSAKCEALIQARADKCTTGSRKWQKLMNAKRSVSSKNHNIRKDAMRKICMEIMNIFHAQKYFIGEASIRGELVTKETGNKKQNLRAHNTGYLSGISRHMVNLVGASRVVMVKDPDFKAQNKNRKKFGAQMILRQGMSLAS